jgi:hypothetical protein
MDGKALKLNKSEDLPKNISKLLSGERLKDAAVVFIPVSS